MSVLIKGMGMPNGCKDCPIMQSDDGCFDFECPFNSYLLWHNAEDVIRYRPDSCPLVEVPTPHGRLIDDFKLLRALIKAFPNQSMNFYDTLERVIDEAPTIIEAEVSKNA